MYYSVDIPLVGGKVFLTAETQVTPKPFTEIRLDSNFEAVMAARFPECNALSIKTNQVVIEKLIERDFASVAISDDGLQILAAQTSDGEWTESGAQNNNGFFVKVNEEFKTVESETLSLKPARDEDDANIKYLYAVSNITYSGVFKGSPDVFKPTIMLLGLPIAMKEEQHLPEEAKRLKEEHSELVTQCKQYMSEECSTQKQTVEDIVISDCDYECSGSMTNVKLHESEFCNNLTDKFPRVVILEALEELI